MDEPDDIESRLEQSIKTLRAWRWMSRISTNRDEVAALLTAEARTLIDLGRQHPGRAKDIGRLIVAYHKLIVQVREGGTAEAA